MWPVYYAAIYTKTVWRSIIGLFISVKFCFVGKKRFQFIYKSKIFFYRFNLDFLCLWLGPTSHMQFLYLTIALIILSRNSDTHQFDAHKKN